MPQMAPMPWVSLEFFFLGCLFIFLSVIYFSPSSGSVKGESILPPKATNWSW
uniref:ATP synthase F0 subunit 8 n=1 Tax=Idotea baltica TaxID=82763 RepID=Q19TW9_9CRUS|nr:ATP synthase F0 subunit 8 [Idotea baltica]